MTVRKAILAAYRAERAVPFAWGTADCLCFAARCAQAIIGRDPIAHLRGRYDSEFSWRRIMVENGWRDMGDVAACLFAEVPVAQARAGDWAHIVEASGRDGLGVVVGDMIAVRTKDSMGQLPLGRASRSFRVE